jgi:hypothetical protein
MDQVNLLPDEMFDRFVQSLENQSDFWKNPGWWDSLELRLTYNFQSTDPISETHLITLASLFAFRILHTDGGEKPGYLEKIDGLTINLINVMNGFEGRKLIEFIQALIPYVKATPQWDTFFNYPSNVDRLWFSRNKIVGKSVDDGDGLLNIINTYYNGPGDVVRIIRTFNDEIVSVVSVLEAFVTRAYSGIFGPLDYFDESFEDVVKRITYERKNSGLLTDKVINRAVSEKIVEYEHRVRYTLVEDDADEYWIQYVTNKIIEELEMNSDALILDVIKAAEKHPFINFTPEKSGRDLKTNRIITKRNLSKIFIELFGEDKLPNEYGDEYSQLITMNQLAWDLIKKRKRVFTNNLNKLQSADLSVTFLDNIYEVFNEEIFGLIRDYRVLFQIKLRIANHRTRSTLTEEDIRRIELYSDQSMKIREILIWVKLINTLLRADNFIPAYFFGDKRGDIIEALENSSPHPYVLKKIMANILYLENELKPTPDNPPVAPFQHLDATSNAPDFYDSDEEEMQKLEKSYFSLLDNVARDGILNKPNDLKVEEMIQREEGFKMRLLENKIKRHAQTVRGAEASDILPGEGRLGFQEMQDDMLQGKTNVGLEKRGSLQDYYPERSLYLDNVMEGDGDKDKGKCSPEEQLSKSLSAPLSLSRGNKAGQAQKKWLEEYDQYFTDTDEASGIPPVSDQSWVYGQGPELSSEVNDIEDRLQKKYRGQQRKALLMNKKFGPAITGAAQKGKSYTPGRRMNYREGRDQYKVPDMLDEQVRQGKKFLDKKRRWERAGVTEPSSMFEDSELVRMAADLPGNDDSEYRQYLNDLIGPRGPEIAAEKLGMVPFTSWSYDDYQSPQSNARQYLSQMRGGGNKERSKRKKKDKPSNRNKKGGKNQDWEKNKGYFGPIMDKKGKLDRDEICHNCTSGAYGSHARRFCKLHDKTWDSKTNKCIKTSKKKKRSKRKGKKKRSKRKK